MSATSTDAINGSQLYSVASSITDALGGGSTVNEDGSVTMPVYNVTNACATGATAFRVAAMAIKAGEASIGLAVGLEQMGKLGLLGAQPASKDKPYQPSGRYGASTILCRVAPSPT